MAQTDSNHMRQLVVFKLGDKEYGTDTLNVKYIEEVLPITRVPRTPSFIKGVINLRGEIVPVMDLRNRFNMPAADVTEETRIIILNVEDIQMGIMVDSVLETLEIPEESVENTAGFGNDVLMDYIIGIGKMDNRIINLLNLSKLVNIF